MNSLPFILSNLLLYITFYETYDLYKRQIKEFIYFILKVYSIFYVLSYPILFIKKKNYFTKINIFFVLLLFV